MEEYMCDRCGQEPAVLLLEAPNDSADAVCRACVIAARKEEVGHDCTNGGTEDWCDDCNPYLQ